MTPRGWNSEWLEVGLSWDEALLLRELLAFVDDHKMAPPNLPYDHAAALIAEMRRKISQVVRARVP